LIPTSPALLEQVLSLERLATLYGVYSRRKARRRWNGGLCSFVGGSSGFWVLSTFIQLRIPLSLQNSPLGSLPLYVPHVLTSSLPPLCSIPGVAEAFDGVVPWFLFSCSEHSHKSRSLIELSHLNFMLSLSPTHVFLYGKTKQKNKTNNSLS